jgi:tripartite-type tricarboxylate transporter receptor subunit TctC
MLRQLVRLSRLAIALALGSLGLSNAGGAQAYPSGTIRFVTGAPPGSPPDIVIRIVTNELARTEGWRIVVENKSGGFGTFAAGEALKQPADGHTILAIAMPTTAFPALKPDMGFGLDGDFVPVIKLMSAHHVLVLNPSVPAKSLPELVALLKSRPDEFNFSSGGFGTPAHLTGELFKLQTGVRVAHVPYPKAVGLLIADLLNGTNHFQFITPLLVLDLIAAGKLRPLAVTGPKRMPILKDVPTVVEAGFPDLVTQDWVGLMVKRGTPDAIVTRLNEAIDKALAKPAVREAFAKTGAEPAGGSPAEFGALVTSQIAHWGKVVKDAGIKIRE